MNFYEAVALLGAYFLGIAYSEGKDGTVDKHRMWVGLYMIAFGAGNKVIDMLLRGLQ